MIFYLYLAFCSLAVFWLITHRLPKRSDTHYAAIICVAVLYMAVRVMYFDGKHPNQTLVFVSFSILSGLIYHVSWREHLFNAAFSAYLLHAINTTYILPLPAHWMSGTASNIRLFIVGLLQVAAALLWDRFISDGKSNRLNRSIRYIVLVAFALENIHLLQGILPDDPVSTERKIYLIWSFIEVEYLGLYMLFESYYAQREKLQAQETELQQQRVLWETKAEQNRELRRIAHDLRHQISMIESMDSEASSALAMVLKHQIDDYLPLPDSGNIVLDAVLNEKLRICQTEHVKLQVEENVSSAGWMEPLDISIIFGNAIENAIEAVRKLPEDARWIRIVIHETESLLMARIVNPYAGEIRSDQNRIVSSKIDTSNHGIGLESIRKSVRKYNGTVNIKDCQQQFQLEIALLKP